MHAEFWAQHYLKEQGEAGILNFILQK